MNRNTSLNSVSQETVIHPEFMPYVAVNQKGVSSFLKAIAVNGVGQAITLAALGIKAKAMIMPNMSREPRCQLVIPNGAWVNSLKWMNNEKKRQTRFLEVTCWQISGAVAEFTFDESDHYGNLGLGDIEDSYRFLEAYESAHQVPQASVLAGCTVVVERFFVQHYDAMDEMATHLFEQGHLDQHEIDQHLASVLKVNLGQQAMAAFQEPWIEGEADRVHRMFIGV